MKPLKYDATVRQADTERAMSTIKPALIPNETKPYAVEFRGACPRCDHQTASRKPLVSVAGSLKMSEDQIQRLIDRVHELGFDLSKGDETFDVTCDCGEKHGGAPEGVRGCGAQWRHRVIWP